MRAKAPDPIPLLKQQLAALIVDHLDGWSQWNAAVLAGTDQPRISDLRNGRLERFSLERLIRLASSLGGQVAIEVKWVHHRWIGARPQRHWSA